MTEFRKAREVPTEMTRNPNVSTENQPEGAARRPRDTLGREPQQDLESGGSIRENHDPRRSTRVGKEHGTREASEGEGQRWAESKTADGSDIWNQRGTLTLGHDQSNGSELPPLPEDRAEPRPLREILGEFAGAPAPKRERYSLVLENGQAFSADDISEMLSRDDSPFR